MVTSGKQVQGVRRSGFHIVDTESKMGTNRVPIWIYEVVEGDIFQVKFEYKARGYKGIRFSERKERVEYE
jgi:hypothetical protein